MPWLKPQRRQFVGKPWFSPMSSRRSESSATGCGYGMRPLASARRPGRGGRPLKCWGVRSGAPNGSTGGGPANSPPSAPATAPPNALGGCWLKVTAGGNACSSGPGVCGQASVYSSSTQGNDASLMLMMKWDTDLICSVNTEQLDRWQPKHKWSTQTREPPFIRRTTHGTDIFLQSNSYTQMQFFSTSQLNSFSIATK